MMTRLFNFNPGPAMLPESVLLRAQAEILNFNQTEISPLEIGHRSTAFNNMLEKLQDKLRKVMNIPNNYSILFLPGGAQTLFSIIPMNLCKYKANADYFVSGSWSETASNFAKRYIKVNKNIIVENHKLTNKNNWSYNQDAAYIYYCPNETITGIELLEIDNPYNVPIVADFTSSILMYKLDVEKFGIIFASAQKNLGISGVSLVIIRNDLLNQSLDITPEIFNFQIQQHNNSCKNTIPTYPVYIMDLIIDWLQDNGGVEYFAKQAIIKSKMLYDYIDNSGFYINNIDKAIRSRANVPFDIIKENLNEAFLTKSQQSGLLNLKGHKSAGGMRASLYNAMPVAGVEALITFMQKFVQENI
jgi:phosphoserine aminotransferase